MSAGSILRARLRLHVLLLTALVAGLVGGPVSVAEAAPATFVVTRLDDPAPDGCTSGVDCSLREAVMAANTNGNSADTDVIEVPAGVITLTIVGLGPEAGDLDITDPVRIVGQGRSGASVTTISGNSIDRVFDAWEPAEFEDLRIVQGAAAAGAGIYATSSVTLRNVELQGNVASGNLTSGGAILARSDVTLIDTVATDNSAPNGSGGAIAVYHDDPGAPAHVVQLLNVEVTGNHAESGAGIDVTAGVGLTSLVATNSTVTRNSATTERAGLTGNFASLSLSGVEVSDNAAPLGQAGINFTGKDTGPGELSWFTATDVSLARNNNGNSAGGLTIDGAHRTTMERVSLDTDEVTARHGLVMDTVSTGTLTDVSVTGSSGPGAILQSSVLELTRVELTQNVASSSSGGGLRVTDGSWVNGTDVTIMDNAATAGGGLAVTHGSTSYLTGLRLLDNLATGGPFLADNSGGGATVFDNSVLGLFDSIIAGNDGDFGGGIHVAGSSTARTTNTQVSDNSARAAGGGIHVTDASTGSSALSTIAGNAAPDGGAIHVDSELETMRLVSSIVADNSAPACAGGGSVTSAGNNVEDTDSCDLVKVTDQPGVDARLQAVSAPDGVTLRPPAPASPAVDLFSSGMCGDGSYMFTGAHLVRGDRDLLGTVRPTNVSSGPGAASGCDAGAFEILPSTVSVGAGTNGVEGATDATFVLTRSGELGGDLTVPLAYTGTAAAADHAAPDSVLMPDGAASVTVSVPVVADDEEEGTETLTATIGTLPALGAGSAATVDLLDATEAGGVQRLFGDNRYETAAANALDRFDPDDVDTVFLATGTNFPDALAGAPLAIDRGAPILLVTPTSLPEVTATALGTLNPDVVIALGGEAAVEASVLTAAAAAAGAGTTTDRIFGANRYETAAAIARAMPASNTAFLSTGGNFPDALAAGSATAGAPILLTPSTALASATADVLGDLGPDTVVALGGEAVVTADVLGAAGTAAGGAGTFRAAGSNRYATGVKIAERLPTPDTVYVAVGTNFPDALAGGPSAFGEGAPIVLVSKDSIPTVVRTWLDDLPALRRVVILGGEGAVSAAVAADLATLID